MARFFRRRARDIARFGRAQRAATAVEFAIIAPVFLATLLAVLQTTLFLFAQATLQSAAMEAGRLFMTGQGQTAGTTQTTFQNDICPMIQPLFNCKLLMVDVEAYSGWSSADASSPTLTFNGQGQVTNTWNYTPGTPGQITVVKLIYEWPLITGPLGYVLPNLGNGTTQIMGVTSFRVEPY